MVGKARIAKSLGEGTARDYKRLTALFKDGRFMAYKKKVVDADARILLAAANNNQEFFEVCEWARKAKLASKPTFSRRKTFLQKLGILGEDDKVAMKIGRPRLKLKLNKKGFKEVYGVKF